MARIVPEWLRKATTNKAIGLKHGFRSGLEEDLGKGIKEAGHTVRFELVKLKYVIPEKVHTYTPDFELDNGIIIEGKGIFDSTDRAKHLLIKMQYPELDIRFVFSRLKAPITKGSKTTMQDWCLKNGYKCAQKAIPSEWFTEPGPALKPAEVIQRGPYYEALKASKKDTAK